SMDNLVASGLFGDGAAAVVLVGDERAGAGPSIVDTRSRLYPDTHDAIGFRLSDTGFRVVLTADVVPAIDAGLAGDAEAMLADAQLGTSDIGTWIAHPGGPRVLDAIERNLHLDPEALRRSRDSLAAFGNLSSVSVLQILAEELDEPHPEGERGMVVAFGPGISAELVLLEW
ncbi:MAG: type III polyketide synthase, partial [Gordonia polyisoprenivorans]|nr:type III polyketide synthase [Gordonia polyisoprenivorans]